MSVLSGRTHCLCSCHWIKSAPTFLSPTAELARHQVNTLARVRRPLFKPWLKLSDDGRNVIIEESQITISQQQEMQ